MTFVRTLTLVLGLTAGAAGAHATAAQPVADAPVSPTMSVVESGVTVYYVGPFSTYAAAARAADVLAGDYGYVTRIVYQDGGYWVLYA